LQWLNSAASSEQKQDWQGLLKVSRSWVRQRPDDELYEVLQELDPARAAKLFKTCIVP